MDQQQLRPSLAQDIYTKAAKAELSANYDEAFRLYIQATEHFLDLSRKSNEFSDTVREKCKLNAGKAIERAEKIKAFVNRSNKGPMVPSRELSTGGGGGGGGGGANVRLTPIAIDHFSPKEQYYVLKRGSRINGLNFPLWDDPPSSSLSSTSQFTDSDGQPPLSLEQRRVSATWSRINKPGTRTLQTISPQKILQHIVTDCSVCASISVCLEHSRRFGSSLARSTLHTSTGIPFSSPLPLSLEDNTATALSITPKRPHQNGRYDVKVFVNGAWRRIVIDDALPINPSDGSLMCMTIHSSNQNDEKPTVYWPSLIEKAYMKLMGGYDFPGSNSSIDLHTIIGWIPEQIDTKCPTFEREKTWERIFSGFTNGNCLVTLGTGPRPRIHWRGIPLLSAHSYAVIDINEDENDRVFTVLDSWVRPEDEQCSRILHIPWSEVVYVFDGIYLSWDPEMWKHHIDFSGMWKRGGHETDQVDANHNLRINFANANSQTEEEIWVLLTRHIRETQRSNDAITDPNQNPNSEFICLRAQVENPSLSPSSASSTTTTTTTAGRSNSIINQRQHELSNTAGTYTNSTHFLVRTKISPTFRSGTVIVMASFEGEKELKEIGFSVAVYSGMNLQISWDENVTPPPFTTKVEGTFTSKNSGGNCSFPTFMVNPQYHLRIHPSTKSAGVGAMKKSTTRVVLKAAKDVPVNAVVIWSKGDRKDELVEQEVAASSGAYTYGLAQVIKNLTPGDYTLIASAFEPRHMGPFTLRVECSTPFDLKPILQEGAGLYTKTVHGSWDEQTGMSSFQLQHQYASNPRFELILPTSGQIKIRLQLIKSGKVGSSSTALNVALFNSATTSTSNSMAASSSSHAGRSNNHHHHNNNGTPITTSGAYREALAGVVTPLVTLSQGKYEIVPSAHTPAGQVEFRLIVYTSASGVELKRIR